MKAVEMAMEKSTCFDLVFDLNGDPLSKENKQLPVLQ